MPRQRTLILSIDGLGSRDLGPWGNTWIDTPAFNRIAARALIFEHTLADATRPDLALGAMICGIGKGAIERQPRPSLESIRATGRESVLITNALDHFPAKLIRQNFGRVVETEFILPDRPAAELESTCCAQFFAQLLELRTRLPAEHVLWAHFAGLTNCWDAPCAWRERLADEEDAVPWEGTRPASGFFAISNPDEQLRQFHGLAAEIMVLDACVGILWDELSDDGGSNFAVVSPRGYPLGEHRSIGYERPVLYSEATSVPIMIADWESPIGWRSQKLAQPSIIHELLGGWHLTKSDHQDWIRTLASPEVDDPILRCVSDDSFALRTAEWLLIHSGGRNELYVKPDDRREFNDVSSRCPDVVPQLLEKGSPSMAPLRPDTFPEK